jgi:septal ring-binding cell division protein DamX
MATSGWPGLIALLVLVSHTALADYQSGLDAYNSGDYNTALGDWKAVAAAPPDTVPPATVAETNYAIGMLYWLGQGVQVDYFEASKWMRKAAELGHAGAQGKLGYLYTQGITVAQNYEVAFEWFSKAATQGDIDGQYNLGIFYLNGWGTPADKTMAAQYLAAAAARGDMDAETALADLLPQLNPSMRAAINSTAALNEPEPAQTTQQGDEPQPQTDTVILPASWILAQNPDHYTIQVIGLRSMGGLENLVRGHDNMAPFAAYVLQRNNLPLHLLVQGVYPDVASAREARDKFPRAIQNPEEVWIRKFEKVQALIQPSAVQ